MTGVVALYGPPCGCFRPRGVGREPFRLFAVGVSATPTEERPMRSLSMHAGVAAIVLALSIPLALAQSGGGGGGAGGAGGAGGGAAGGSAAGAAGGAGATGGAAGTGAASPSATT